MNLDSIFNEDWPQDHRSGIVAVVGRANVGKSTLINAILKQKVAITTPKPQTTRRNQLGIYTEKAGQILFVDTPGLHKPKNKMGEYMMALADSALNDADIILWILDASEPPQKSDQHIAETLKQLRNKAPLVLVLNKIDRIDEIDEEADFTEHLALLSYQQHFKISATENHGIAELVQALLKLLPQGPRYYPVEQISDMNMRFIAAEIVREKAILNTEYEVPHAIAVEITDYKEHEERTVIYATIYVERETQKGIVVGKGGQMIKKIGTQARREIKKLIERPVHLELHVKVLKNWRSNETFMRRIGYKMPKADDD